MIVSFFGPRIQDLGGFTDSDLQEVIKKNMHNKLRELKKEHDDITVITGLNLGIETWAAEQALSLKIPYQVYIPFENPQSKWPLKTRQHYSKLLKAAQKKIQINTGSFSSAKMHDKESRLIMDSDYIGTFFAKPHPVLNVIKRNDKQYEDLLGSSDETEEFYIEL